MTWLFHSQFTQVIQDDIFNDYLGFVYAYLFACIFVDNVFYKEVISMAQAVAMILIVAPSGVLFMLRQLGIIRK